MFSVAFFISCESNGILSTEGRITFAMMICNFCEIDSYRLRYLALFVVFDRQIANIQGCALILNNVCGIII